MKLQERKRKEFKLITGIGEGVGRANGRRPLTSSIAFLNE